MEPWWIQGLTLRECLAKPSLRADVWACENLGSRILTSAVDSTGLRTRCYDVLWCSKRKVSAARVEVLGNIPQCSLRY